ncbi:MAG: LptF/LptG family permease [Chthoniobacteraceae bacterium]
MDFFLIIAALAAAGVAFAIWRQLKLIDRYVGRQVLLAAIFGVAVLSVVLVLGNVFKKLSELLVSHDVPAELILSLLAYILPFSLTFTIPWGFLTAVLLVFGRLSAENELIALRSSGVSVPRVAMPVFALSLASVCVCLWINVDVAPRAQKRMQEAFFNIATSNPLALFSSDKVIDEFPGRKIYVGRKETPEERAARIAGAKASGEPTESGVLLFNLLVYELTDEFLPRSIMHARKGELLTDRDSKKVMMTLYDARYEQRDEEAPRDVAKINQGITMQRTPIEIPLQDLYEKNKKKRGPSAMTIQELLQDPVVAGSSAAKVEVSKRFAIAIAPFAFALFAVPLAITAHRRETSIGFMLSLGIAFAYFFLVIVIDWLKNKPEWHPELLIFAPNVIFVALGGWLFHRLSRR